MHDDDAILAAMRIDASSCNLRARKVWHGSVATTSAPEPRKARMHKTRVGILRAVSAGYHAAVATSVYMDHGENAVRSLMATMCFEDPPLLWRERTANNGGYHYYLTEAGKARLAANDALCIGQLETM